MSKREKATGVENLSTTQRIRTDGYQREKNTRDNYVVRVRIYGVDTAKDCHSLHGSLRDTITPLER